jgi:RNA polymerase sigma factor (sigma-70 family)
MPTSPATSVFDHLRGMLLRDAADLGDGELLSCFIERRDSAALAALVTRHGPMVWGVCRRLLSHHDAEDAFQATFLVLVRKASSVVPRDMLANWLYGVAHQTALQARRTAARRRIREVQVTALPDTEGVQPDPCDDLQPLIDQEVSRLPGHYRAVFVLCDLEGRTRQEVARQLGVPLGTVAGRLARARALLARRLAQRGITLSGGALVAPVAPVAPVALVSTTIHAVSSFAAGPGAATGVIAPQVAALTQGVLNCMLLTKLKIALAVLLMVVGLLVAGLAALPALAQKPAEQMEDNELDQGRARKQDPVKVVQPGGKSVRSLAYCNDGKTVALVLYNGRDYREGGSVVLWDVQTEKVQQTLEKCGNIAARAFCNVTSSRDGTTVAFSSGLFRDRWQGAIQVWDARTGKLAQAFELDGLARAVALSTDGTKVIGGARVYPKANGKMIVWDVQRGAVMQTLEAEGMLYSAAAISDDSKWIAGAGDVGDPTYQGKVVVWEVQTGKVKHEWAGLPAIYTVAIAPDGKQVAAAGPVAAVGPGAAPGPAEQVIRVWDMQTGKLKHQLKPQGGHTLTGLVFSPDGATLATADADGSVSLWDLAKEQSRVTLKGHDGPVWCVAFSPDGQTLASGGDDGTLRLWPVAPATQPQK